jgi:hypothetical protein
MSEEAANAHYSGMGGETGNEAGIRGKICGFVGVFEDFGGGEQKQRAGLGHPRIMRIPIGTAPLALATWTLKRLLAF